MQFSKLVNRKCSVLSISLFIILGFVSAVNAEGWNKGSERFNKTSDFVPHNGIEWRAPAHIIIRRDGGWATFASRLRNSKTCNPNLHCTRAFYFRIQFLGGQDCKDGLVYQENYTVAHVRYRDTLSEVRNYGRDPRLGRLISSNIVKHTRCLIIYRVIKGGNEILETIK